MNGFLVVVIVVTFWESRVFVKISSFQTVIPSSESESL